MSNSPDSKVFSCKNKYFHNFTSFGEGPFNDKAETCNTEKSRNLLPCSGSLFPEFHPNFGRIAKSGNPK